MGESLETPHHNWLEIRSNITESTLDSALTVTTRVWASKPTGAYSLPKYVNAAILRFRMGGSITSCGYEVYVYRDRDDAEFVCSGTVTRGTQTATKPVIESAVEVTTYYGHQITVTDRWLKDVKSTQSTTGNNEMAKIAFDCCGAQWLLVQMVATCTGTGSMSVDLSGF